MTAHFNPSVPAAGDGGQPHPTLYELARDGVHQPVVVSAGKDKGIRSEGLLLSLTLLAAGRQGSLHL